MAMEGLGRVFNVIPLASARPINLKAGQGVTFIVTGNDTFTLAVADSFAGSYATPGNIITKRYTNTSTNGTAAWVTSAQAAAATVVIASGSAAFYVDGNSLPDTKTYVRVTAGASGTVTAIVHDLYPQRKPDNLAPLSA